MEAEADRVTLDQGVAGADLAVPLNYLTTWSLRRVQMRQYSEKSAETVTI